LSEPLHPTEKEELLMSVTITESPVRLIHGPPHPRQITDHGRPRPASPKPPTWTETLTETAAEAGAPAFYGPPIGFLFGPWLLLVLFLIPPFAVAFTVGLVLAVGAALLAALGALIAIPYLLVHHLQAHLAHRARQPKAHASPPPVGRQRASSAPLGSPQLKGMS
jgi:hypothetical protein